jgi:hypothetical protein
MPVVKVQGLNLDLEKMSMSPETFLMVRLLEKGKLSLSVGGNSTLAAGTIGYKLNLPVSLHGGVTYPWKNLGSFDFRIKPGIFAGFEIRF